MNPVRWGVLSTARIATLKVIPGMRKSPLVEVAAIASRDLARAEQAAADLGIANAYGSYEELLADPTIEAVYNPLPNHLHVPMTLAAVQAGKHVLCEKPMALTADELEALRPYADKVHIREAFMVHFHPQWIAARDAIRSGAIGKPTFIQVGFSYFNDEPGNIRNRVELGGGALYDIGCYAIVAGRWFFDANPSRAVALTDRDPTFGVDRCTSGLLEFDGGRQLSFSVSTQAAPYQRIVVAGSQGRIEIEIPFNAPQDASCRYRIDDGSSLDGRSAIVTDLPVADQYERQAEAFSKAIREERPSASGLEDALWNMRTIGALFRSANSSSVEVV